MGKTGLYGLKPDQTPSDSPASLQRGLTNRHIQMISLGGTIGVGLFLGSGSAIHRAGPGLLITYLIAGAAVFLILRALGELALHKPVSGSFASYASEYISPMAGFITGWTYWFTWIVTITAEITAMGIYVAFWFPNVDPWVTALVIVIVLLGTNLLSVRVYGETEFWFATIKVVTILGLIFGGLAIIIFGVGDLGETASFAHLWDQGGLFPNGFFEVLIALQMVMFAFFGLEMIGIAAGETKDPSTSLPKAINRVGLRLGLFYFGSLLIIMALIPWQEINPQASPFVLVFQKIGIPAAGSVMNFVVLTAAFSSSNSAIFGTGRMLFSLAGNGQAPKLLQRLNRHKVPAAAIALSTIALTLAVVVNYLVPKQAFLYVTSVATLGAIWTWAIILISHMRYRRSVSMGKSKESTYKLPGAPITSGVTLAFLVGVVILLGYSKETRIALYVAPFWGTIVVAGYYINRRLNQKRGITMGAADSLSLSPTNEIQPWIPSTPFEFESNLAGSSLVSQTTDMSDLTIDNQSDHHRGNLPSNHF